MRRSVGEPSGVNLTFRRARGLSREAVTGCHEHVHVVDEDHDTIHRRSMPEEGNEKPRQSRKGTAGSSYLIIGMSLV